MSKCKKLQKSISQLLWMKRKEKNVKEGRKAFFIANKLKFLLRSIFNFRKITYSLKLIFLSIANKS